MAHEAARRAGDARPQCCRKDGSDTSIMMGILFLSAREGVLSSSKSFESLGRTQANTTRARFDLSSISAARLTPCYTVSLRRQVNAVYTCVLLTSKRKVTLLRGWARVRSHAAAAPEL